MGIRNWLYHKHHWGIPHRREGERRIIQVCYECGKERELTTDLGQAGGDTGRAKADADDKRTR